MHEKEKEKKKTSGEKVAKNRKEIKKDGKKIEENR